MDLIKSVRVRPENTKIYDEVGSLSDYKLMLFKEAKKKYKIGWLPVEGGVSIGLLTTIEYKKAGIYENFTEQDFIIEGLNLLSNINKRTYGIIQDPWENKPPIIRNYGVDPHYLNNGSKVYIDWYEGPKRVGGLTWSDKEGNELDFQIGSTQSTKSNITKNLRIVSDSEILEISKDGVLSKYYSVGREYSGRIKDIDIIKQLINLWKIEVPNYDLKLCDKQYEPCSILEYKSPLVKENLPDSVQNNVLPVTETALKFKREKLNIVLPTDLKLKVKQDIPSVRVYIGEVVNEITD
jgi:3D (Asp-Asp-Asp) domain-containing protein